MVTTLTPPPPLPGAVLTTYFLSKFPSLLWLLWISTCLAYLAEGVILYKNIPIQKPGNIFPCFFQNVYKQIIHKWREHKYRRLVIVQGKMPVTYAQYWFCLHKFLKTMWYYYLIYAHMIDVSNFITMLQYANHMITKFFCNVLWKSEGVIYPPYPHHKSGCLGYLIYNSTNGLCMYVCIRV